MNKRRVITIGGGPGAGKSSASKLLAQKLGYTRFSGGDFRREYCEKKGMDFETCHELMEKDLSIDRELDDFQKKYMEEHEDIVVDSHAGFFFNQNGFKVFLTLNKDTAAQRIFNDSKVNPNRKVEEQFQNPEEAYEYTAKRAQSNTMRFKEMFGETFNQYSPASYNITIDTAPHNLEEVVSIIIAEYEKWLSTEN